MTKITEKSSFKFNSPLKLEYSYKPEMDVISEDTESEITFEVRENGYGWFEFYNEENDQHMEGGLWFEGNDLIDYDGCFDLPQQLQEKLKGLGYNLDQI